MVVWFTGLSGAGKSTLAKALREKLSNEGQARIEHLDGDELRALFNERDFSREGRDRQVKWTGLVASRLEKHGVLVLVTLISPYRASRDFARSLCKDFVEVHVATPLEECERRDVKGLYRKARAGELKGFTGIDDPYEAPLKPELTIATQQGSLESHVETVLAYLKPRLTSSKP